MTPPPRRPPEDAEAVKRLWSEYKVNPSAELQREIITRYNYIIRSAVARFIKRKPYILDYDDLYQAGLIGLMDAADRFNPEQGVLFQTYASTRVSGSIVDEIRKMNWSPRSVTDDIKSVLKSVEQVYAKQDREPSIEDIVSQSGLTEKAVRNALASIEKNNILHFDSESLGNSAPQTDSVLAESNAEIKYIIDTCLEGPERQFVQLRFLEGYAPDEIMIIMMVSRAELAALHETTVQKLLEALGKTFD